MSDRGADHAIRLVGVAKAHTACARLRERGVQPAACEGAAPVIHIHHAGVAVA